MKLTRITSDGEALAKTISIDGDDLRIESRASMSGGFAERLTCATLPALAEAIRSLEQNQAMVWGDYRKPQDRVEIVLKGNESNGSIARTKAWFFFADGESIFSLDYDDDEPLSFDQIIEYLASLYAPFSTASHIRIPSSSGGIKDASGKSRKTSTGKRILFPVKVGSDIERFSNALYELAWLNGFGRIKISATGKPMRRVSLFDKSVHSPERLDFLASPILMDGLQQDRKIEIVEGDILDTRKLSDPTSKELLKAAEETDKAKHLVRQQCAAVKSQYKKAAKQKLIDKGIDPDVAAETIESRLTGYLLGCDFLKLDNGEEPQVRDVLADPEKFAGCTLEHPLEPEGKNKAVIFFNDPDTVINANRHGGQNFVLRYDFESLAAIFEAAEKMPKIGKLFGLARVGPVDKDQLLKIIKDKFKASIKTLREEIEHKKEGSRKSLTHQQMADRYVEEHGTLKYTDGEIWKPDDRNIWRKIQKERVQYEIGNMFNDQPRASTQSQYRQVMFQIQNTIADDEFFADAPFGIAGPSGFVTIDNESGALSVETLTADHRQKFSVPFDANLKNPKPEMMLKFLDDCFKECEPKLQKMRLQESFGTALAGCGSQYEKAFFLIGPGNSGKSTVFRVLERFIPSEFIASPNPGAMNTLYSLAQMAGAQIVLWAEMDGASLGATFKSLIGRDSIDARQPGYPVFTFKNTAMGFGVSNVYPRLDDAGSGMIRRLEVLKFPHSRIAAERQGKVINDPHHDRHIVDHDAGELLGWFMLGASRVVKNNGYTKSVISETEVRKWQGQSDPLSAYLQDDDHVSVGKNKSVKRSWFFSMFEVWCESMNIRKVPSRIELGELMETHGYVARKTSGEFMFYGVTVSAVEPEDEETSSTTKINSKY